MALHRHMSKFLLRYWKVIMIRIVTLLYRFDETDLPHLSNCILYPYIIRPLHYYYYTYPYTIRSLYL